MDSEFWAAFDNLVAAYPLVIDRPCGSAHPRRPELIYPLDYGYLEGTVSGDGMGIDVWAGSGVGLGVVGLACTVDLGKRDAEIKILLNCTPAEVELVDRFLNVTAGLPCKIVPR